MRLLIAYLAIACSAYAQQLLNPQGIGVLVPTGNNGANIAFSSASTYYAQGFIAPASKTLSSVSLYCVSVTGTLGSSDTVVALYSDSGSGAPGSSVESHAGKCATTSVLNITGFSTALTAGTQYWWVITNANASPGTNYFDLYEASVGTSALSPYTLGLLGGGIYGTLLSQTTNTGSTWAALNGTPLGMYWTYSDSTFQGLMISSATRPGNAPLQAYGKQQAGAAFLLPANATYSVAGIAMLVDKSGSPGTLAFDLWTGSTKTATTATIPAAQVNTTGTSQGVWYFNYFSSPQSLTGGLTYRVTMQDGTTGDASGTGYNTQVFTVPNDTTALALKPMNGTVKQTVTTDGTGSSATFTDTATNYCPFVLLLNTNGEFVSGGAAIVPVYPIQ